MSIINTSYFFSSPHFILCVFESFVLFGLKPRAISILCVWSMTASLQKDVYVLFASIQLNCLRYSPINTILLQSSNWCLKFNWNRINLHSPKPREQGCGLSELWNGLLGSQSCFDWVYFMKLKLEDIFKLKSCKRFYLARSRSQGLPSRWIFVDSKL